MAGAAVSLGAFRPVVRPAGRRRQTMRVAAGGVGVNQGLSTVTPLGLPMGQRVLHASGSVTRPEDRRPAWRSCPPE